MGDILKFFGIEFIFSINGIILAQFFVITPYMIRILRTIFAGLDPYYEFAERTLGLNRFQAFIRATEHVEHNRQNVIRGQVKDIIFSGNLMLLEVKVALDFVILVAKNTEVSIDELVYIEIDRKAVHVLAEGGCHEHL